MKKDKWLVGGMVVVFLFLLILIGGVIVTKSNQASKERKEQQVLKMEEVTAQRIKNTFVGVTEIKFDEKHWENKITGYSVASITVKTDYGLNSLVNISMSPSADPTGKLRSWADIPELTEGETKKIVKVTLSNKEEKSL